MTGDERDKDGAGRPGDEPAAACGNDRAGSERGLSLVTEPDEAAEPSTPPTGADETGPAREGGEALEQLTRRCADLEDQVLRRRADLENYRRRAERDRRVAVEEAVADLLKALVPTLDNLERALAAAGSEGTLREGIALVQRDLLGMLEARGLRVVDPAGQPFDPTHHQALSHEVTPGSQPGTVVEVFAKGYLLGDRLLRPALVKVAKAAEGEADGTGRPETLH